MKGIRAHKRKPKEKDFLEEAEKEKRELNESYQESKRQTKERKYQNLADCIRSDQLSARQVVQEMEADPEFKEWYKKRYLK